MEVTMPRKPPPLFTTIPDIEKARAARARGEFTEIRRTTSIPQLERRIDNLMKLVEKQGLIEQPMPRIICVTDGSDRDAILAFLGKRHSAFDKRGVEYFTLRLDNKGPMLPDDAA
jgi:hypothetical protein